MAWKLSNFASSTLRQSVLETDTTLYIDADDVDLLPTLGVGDKAKLIIFNASDREIVNITAWNTDGTLTVERAQETTVAIDWAAGTKVVHGPTAEFLQAAINALTQSRYTGTATGTDAYTVDVGVGGSIPSLVDGEEITFEIPNTNTGAVTLVVTNGSSSTAALAVRQQNAQALAADDFVAGFIAVLRYNAADGAWDSVTETGYNEQAATLNGAPVPAVNRHPNGRFDFWNNGTSFVTQVTGTQVADGVYLEYDGSIGTFTVSRQTFTLGQTDVPGNPKYWLRWAHTAAGSGSTLRRLRIPLPDVTWSNSRQITRTFWAKADAARTVNAKILQYFGTGGAPSADVTVTTLACSLTTSWQKFTVTVTAPSIAGKTLGSGANDALVLTFDLPLNVTMTIDVAVDDLRPGRHSGLQSPTFPVPFERGGLGGSFPSLAAIKDYLDVVIGTNVQAWSAGLDNYAADPMSVAELASITGTFGTAAFVTDVSLVHIAGTETISGAKTFSADMKAAAASPRFIFDSTGGAANERLWDIIGSGGDLLVRSRTDADGAGVTALTFDRGTGTAINGITAGVAVTVPDGTAAAPGLRTTTEAHGLYRVSSTQLGLSAAGVLVGSFGAGQVNLSGTTALLAPAGNVSLPGLVTRVTDTDSGRYSIADNNNAEATNGVLRFDWNTTRLQIGVGFDVVMPATAVAPTSVYSVGFRGAPVKDGNSAYAFPATDAGHAIYHDEAGARTYTIPANGSVAHPIGTVFIIDNTGNSGAAGAITLAITTDTLRRGDGTAGTGTRTIPASAVAAIRKVAAQEWRITGIFT